MKFVTSREFISQPLRILKLAEKENVVAVSARGQTHYLITRLEKDDLEDLILADHLEIEKDWRRSEREFRQGKTIPLSSIKIPIKRRDKKEKSRRKR
ncbi:MAG: hypothetical protein A2V67_09615 [Deltaproteobacteria bacterium RBG_13_61_14]|nr:MAG: hypothetical protein A2V67_09615 [Deltaproteobacteria bacterium RBG_13_61_14]